MLSFPVAAIVRLHAAIRCLGTPAIRGQLAFRARSSPGTDTSTWSRRVLGNGHLQGLHVVNARHLCCPQHLHRARRGKDRAVGSTCVLVPGLCGKKCACIRRDGQPIDKWPLISLRRPAARTAQSLLLESRQRGVNLDKERTNGHEALWRSSRHKPEAFETAGFEHQLELLRHANLIVGRSKPIQPGSGRKRFIDTTVKRTVFIHFPAACAYKMPIARTGLQPSVVRVTEKKRHTSIRVLGSQFENCSHLPCASLLPACLLRGIESHPQSWSGAICSRATASLRRTNG